MNNLETTLSSSPASCPAILLSLSSQVPALAHPHHASCSFPSLDCRWWTEDTSLQLWSVTDPANSGSTAVAHQSLFACLVVFLTQTHRDWARLFPICSSSRLLLNSHLGSWEEPARRYHGQGQPSGVWAPNLPSIPPSLFTMRGRSSPARLPHEPTAHAHHTPAHWCCSLFLHLASLYWAAFLTPFSFKNKSKPFIWPAIIPRIHSSLTSHFLPNSLTLHSHV